MNGRRVKVKDQALSFSKLVPGLGQAYDGKKDYGALVLMIILMLLEGT
ncbi:MAG: hypothetical protein ABR986_10925 [Methanomassiliicoccales archaeon]|jgi:hypothetical protein